MTESSKLIPPYSPFEDPVSNKLLGIVLALTSEVWSLKHRLYLLESVLQENSSLDISKAIDQKSHSEELGEELKTYVSRILRDLGQT
tara:strand:- start:1331 stop:1591 length:261 start_codon:yes stop_codon:yes gene_type:complete